MMNAPTLPGWVSWRAFDGDIVSGDCATDYRTFWIHRHEIEEPIGPEVFILTRTAMECTRLHGAFATLEAAKAHECDAEPVTGWREDADGWVGRALGFRFLRIQAIPYDTPLRLEL